MTYTSSEVIPTTDDVAIRASQLWQRIKRRFELSSVWRIAPPELVATEFLSVVRFTLAPARVECALYDLTTKATPLAATLPPIIQPPNDGDVPTPDRLGFDTAAFYANGGSAAVTWLEAIRVAPPGPWKAGAERYAEYLARFSQPPVVVTIADTLVLRILVDRECDASGLAAVVQASGLRDLLDERTGGAAAFHGEWQPIQRRLTDYLLHEFLDRLENDLAILIGGEAADIWVLLLDEAGTSLQFHAPKQKLARLLKHYETSGPDGRPEPPTVGSLRHQVEEGHSGALLKYLAPCETGFHKYLHWQDAEPLTVDHLECIAEKFQGWPVDRGIAASVVATGCGEVVRNFAGDYRVEAYTYDRRPSRLELESDRFFRVRLAERVFINISPHLVELPLLWGLNAENEGRCGALLLVLFNGGADQHAPDYFARRALTIRDAIEPWYFLFEQHAKLMEWNRVIHGHVMHEATNAFNEVKDGLDEARLSRLSERLALLWSAYSFVLDSRGPEVDRMALPDFVQFIDSTVRKGMATDERFSYRLSTVYDDHAIEGCSARIAPKLVDYLLTRFLHKSLATLANLLAVHQLEADDGVILVRIDATKPTLPEDARLIVEIEHAVTAGVAAFVKEHGSTLGRSPIFTDDVDDHRRTAHLGLFYMGVLLRTCGGEFIRPRLDEQLNRVTWSLGFPLLR